MVLVLDEFRAEVAGEYRQPGRPGADAHTDGGPAGEARPR